MAERFLIDTSAIIKYPNEDMATFENSMAEENFEIKLPQFEGPFDLLLFFIEAG